MTEYYMGVLLGAAGGYCLALITLLMMWALCVVAKEREEAFRKFVERVKGKKGR